MGQVVAFQTRGRSPRHPSEPPTGDAQILFFLGVRYLRPDDSSAAQTPGRGPQGGRRRKGRRA